MKAFEGLHARVVATLVANNQSETDTELQNGSGYSVATPKFSE